MTPPTNNLSAQAGPVRVLGRSGLRAPALGLGCWAIGGPAENLGLPMGWSTAPDEAAAMEALEVGYAAGVRLFDTADVYGHGRSERLLGGLVAQVPREDLVLVSKVGYFAGDAEHGYDPGHMRRQLERTLINLRTDHLDIYFLHHSQFGPNDQWLPGAVETMRRFQAEGLVRAVGMRGPHRFALDRLSSHLRPTTTPGVDGGRPDKVARFRVLFAQIQPEVLAVRDNLLTPADRSEGIFAFADLHDVGILVNKPLAQGLLTGRYDPFRPPIFGAGDHRLRKRWFTGPGLELLDHGLRRLQRLTGSTDPRDLVRVAVWSCLSRSPRAVALVGFTSAEQVKDNLAAVGAGPPTDHVLQRAREIFHDVQQQLDAQGEVFVDEANRGEEADKGRSP